MAQAADRQGGGRLGALPVQLTSFVGREAELEELGTLLRTSRLITIVGTAGLGKTRLAIELAARESGQGGLEVWFASLAALTDEALVPQEIAWRLGVRQLPDQPLVETLAAYIGARRALLLIDNCEHLVDASARLVDTLLARCPNLVVVATSRRPLRVPGEVVWRIAPLSLPEAEPGPVATSDATRLFEARARLLRQRFRIGPDNAATIAQICRRLDGIPLAIELAAARTEMMSVEDILARLDDRFGLLRGTIRVSEPRHQTLLAALDWGYQLLDEKERRLFRRLSVFRGGFDPAAAEAVCAGNGVERHEVAELVFQLVEESLLVPDLSRPGPTRYNLLETTHEYGVQRLTEHGELADISRRHAAYYVALAEQAERHERSADLAQWLERLESEHDNLRAAAEWCRRNDPPSWLRLASALTWFWVTRGYLREGGEQLEAALAGAAGDALADARALLSMARLCFWQGDYPAARDLCERALRLYAERADDRGRALALTLLGSIHGYEGDYERGRKRLEEALELVEDEDIRMETLVGLGEVLIQMGELAEARVRLDEVRALARGPEAPRGRAALFLGLVHFFQGDYAGARANIARCLGIFQRLGNRYALSAALDVSAALALSESRPLDALRLSGVAAALRDQVRAPLSPRWQEILETFVIGPASEAAGADGVSAWTEGQRMSPDTAISGALEVLHSDPTALGGTGTGPGASEERLAGLSARETEVAKLLAQGMTNRQVAERLGVAERTAEGHVERIRRKLGVRTRTQIAIAVLKGDS